MADTPASGDGALQIGPAAVRGLALEAVFMRNRQEVEESIKVLGETLRCLYPALADQQESRP